MNGRRDSLAEEAEVVPLPWYRRMGWRIDPGGLYLRLAATVLVALVLALQAATLLAGLLPPELQGPRTETLLRMLAGCGSLPLVLGFAPAPPRRQLRDLVLAALLIFVVVGVFCGLIWLAEPAATTLVKLALIPLAVICLYLPRFTGSGPGLGKALFSVALVMAILKPPAELLLWLLLACALGSLCFLAVALLLPKPRAQPHLDRAQTAYRQDLAARVQVLATSRQGRIALNQAAWLGRQGYRQLLRRAFLEDPAQAPLYAAGLQCTYRLELTFGLLGRALATADALSPQLWLCASEALEQVAEALLRPGNAAANDQAKATINRLRGMALALPDVEADSRRHVVGAAAGLGRMLLLSQALADKTQRALPAPAELPSYSPPGSRLSPLDRLALQGLCGVALASLLDLGFQMEHGYWATITVFLIVSGSLGETLLRGQQRLIGTAIGVGAALLAVWAFSGTQEALLAMAALAALGLVVFSMPRFYLTASIGIGFMVVTTLHLVEGLTVPEMLARIYETAIGAAIGILVAHVVLPQRLTQSLRHDLNDWLAKAQDLLLGLDKRPLAELRAQSQELAARAAAIGDNLAQIKAEAWLGQRDLAQPVNLHTALEALLGHLALLERVSQARPFAEGKGASDTAARRLHQAVWDGLEDLRQGAVAPIDERARNLDQAFRSGQDGVYATEAPLALDLRLEQIFYLAGMLQIIADLAHAIYPETERRS
ncbi:MAG: FUSC family protein [Pseudomonadota bacterium]